MVIVSTAKISSKHQEYLTTQFPSVTWLFCEKMDEALKYKDTAEVLITFGEDLKVDVIEQFSRLKWIQVLSAGVERIPLQEIEQRGIIITNARGIHRTPMSEYTLGLMLQHIRRFPALFTQQQQLLWDRNPRIDELAEKTLGILGAGAIGGEIARKAKAFDMHVIGMNQSGESVPYFDQMYTSQDLVRILEQSDFLVVIVPLTSATQNLIGEKELRMMKKSAVLINISRGAVVDEQALITALREEWIEAAYLDVFVEEPLPQEHPFWTLQNCWITPHISGRSPNYMSRAMSIFEKNLKAYVQGKIDTFINRVSAKKGY